MKNYAEQIRAFIPKGRTYKVLGTDGFGRSDFRSKLREHFEVNRHYIVVAALKALADEGTRAGGQGGRGDREVRHQRRQDQPAVRITTTHGDTHMALVEVKVPDIGDFKDVEVIELLVKPGDTVDGRAVAADGRESDKASMEIPSSHAGVVKELKVKLGDKVSEGTLVLVLEAAGAAAAAPAAPAAAPAAAARGCACRSGRRRRQRRAASAGPVEVLVPDIGDFDEVAVIEVFVKPGDTRQGRAEPDHGRERQGLDGDPVVARRRGQGGAGQARRQGRARAALVAIVEASGGRCAGAGRGSSRCGRRPRRRGRDRASAPAAGRSSPTAALPPHEPTAPKGALPHASPIDPPARARTRRAARRGQGQRPEGPHHAGRRAGLRQGRDGRRACRPRRRRPRRPRAAAAGGGAFPGLLPWPQVDFAKFGPIERKDLSRIKKISGANLHRNWVMIPHVTNHDDADITELEAFRVQLNKENEKRGIKVTMLAFLIKACGRGAEEVPRVQRLARRRAAGAEAVLPHRLRGRHAERPGGAGDQGRRQEGHLPDRAGDGRTGQEGARRQAEPGRDERRLLLDPSLGGIGGRYFTPIINAPEVAILGVCKSSTEPLWDGKAFVPRLILPLSLSWDHRVIDGAAAARFNAYLGQILADFRRVLL